MPKQKCGILGVKKDPKNQILFFSRHGEEWPSDDSEDSDYLPSDLEDDAYVSKRKKKQDKKNEKIKVVKTDHLDICVDLPPLPTEIWLKIFQDVVSVAGPLPFLCRAQKVCTHWRDLAEHPSLWRKIDLSYGWIKSKEQTLRYLCENRLSQCEDINLSNWTLSNALRLVAENCPHLQNVNLSQCKKLSVDGVTALADNCTQLRDIDVSNTGITSASLKDLITKRCSTLQRIDISNNNKLPAFSTVLDTIMTCCNLTVLDISNLEYLGGTYINIDMEKFHISCPKLQIIRMGNNRYKAVDKSDPERENSPGFPDLEEFLYPDLNGKSYMHNTITWYLFQGFLSKSPKLKVLDVRGRCNDCYTALADIPATDVESLHIGMTSMCLDDPYGELLLKWRHSFKTVDLSWIQNVEIGIKALTDGPPIPLERIQLTGSNIIDKDLKSLLNKSPQLKYIQLESCRNLFRGIKRLYQGEEIKILKDKLRNISI